MKNTANEKNTKYSVISTNTKISASKHSKGYQHSLSLSHSQMLLLQDNRKLTYDRCVPWKRKKLYINQNPWFDDEIKALIQIRDDAYARWKRFKIPELH